MLALRMRQKDSEFYFVSYRAEDLLGRVRFETRFYGERGETVGGDAPDDDAPAAEAAADEVEQYVRAIERSSGAFQRELNRRKVRQIRDFFRNETDQPVVPGAVLLFTSEELKFTPIGQYEQMGDLALPRSPFLIIDGQHRLAGLHFYLREPDADRRVEVPCVIFDGKAAEFATEMFVIINSTHTRINKSHLVDLYEKIEWGTDPHKKLAARLVRALYDESDSPLRYHVNMLGGRSQRDMWINQAQLFGEVHRFVTRKDAETWTTDGRGLSRDRAYGFLRDVLRAAKQVFGDAWGDNKRYMVTRDVTLKALIRFAGDVAAKSRALGLSPAASAGTTEASLVKRFERWTPLVAEFRRDGFYERFPARGQVERVEKIRDRLRRDAGL
ncbi:MAG TPA: DGQHR domain-containing protein [Gammaproteobacteria bacterium]|nr:DGQHR domain-containing protein [Gammaproteobacteria bacterium]